MIFATIYSSLFFARSRFERSDFRCLKTCSTLFCSGVYGRGSAWTIICRKIGSTEIFSSATIIEHRYSLPNQSQSFAWRISKMNIMCSDFMLPVFSMNVYLRGSIIAAFTLIIALGRNDWIRFIFMPP